MFFGVLLDIFRACGIIFLIPSVATKCVTLRMGQVIGDRQTSLGLITKGADATR